MMVIPQIFITASITVLLILGLWGGLMLAMNKHRWKFFWLLIPAMPLSTIVNHWIKAPINRFVVEEFSISNDALINLPLLYLIFLLLLAPITEELIKVSPLVNPDIRHWLEQDAIWVGYVLGLGFGIGEAGYLAYGISQSPAFADLPWYLFTGYLGERLLVSFMHAFMTIVFLKQVQRGRRYFLVGWVYAIGWHTLVNISAFLYQLGLIPIWATNISLLVLLVFMVFIFERYRKEWIQKSASQEFASRVVYFRRED